MDTQKKLCGKCGEMKVFTDFHYRWSRRRKDGSLDKSYYSPCKKCVSKKRRERRHNNPDVRLHEIVRDLHGITGEDYKKMVADQNGVCAICGNAEKVIRNGKLQRLSVDHCHKTNKIRGLLCDRCNIAIGCFKDEIAILESAIAYLKSHS